MRQFYKKKKSKFVTLSFGKYKDRTIDRVPKDYLEWLTEQDWIDNGLNEYIHQLFEYWKNRKPNKPAPGKSKPSYTKRRKTITVTLEHDADTDVDSQMGTLYNLVYSNQDAIVCVRDHRVSETWAQNQHAMINLIRNDAQKNGVSICMETTLITNNG